jgi:hypothetical protein
LILSIIDALCSNIFNYHQIMKEMDLAADFEATSPSEVTQDQAEVVLVGCGAPNRGMGWYHAVQMLEGR